MVTDMVADMVTDMVADMEVDKLADMVADMSKTKSIKPEMFKNKALRLYYFTTFPFCLTF